MPLSDYAKKIVRDDILRITIALEGNTTKTRELIHQSILNPEQKEYALEIVQEIEDEA